MYSLYGDVYESINSNDVLETYNFQCCGDDVRQNRHHHPRRRLLQQQKLYVYGVAYISTVIDSTVSVYDNNNKPSELLRV